MTVSMGVIMDPIARISPYKDSTLAMLLAAQARGWSPFVATQDALWLEDGRTWARLDRLRVEDDDDRWFEVLETIERPLDELDLVLMRKDPPFDMDFFYTTHLLDRAAARGVLVSNDPSALRDTNEKLVTAHFPELGPPTLVTARAARLKAFVREHGDAIVKPLDGMGGAGIYRLRPDDPNMNMILETQTQGDTRQIMAQVFLPEIVDGDKRILVVNGEAHAHALARIPADGETRGNLAAGGRGVPVELSSRDREIVEAVGPFLVERGILFAGVDVIGSSLTEINVTSPTCIRELDAHDESGDARGAPRGNARRPGIADRYLDALQSRLQDASGS